MFDIDVHRHGPVFDGRAEAAVDAFLEDAKHEIAEEGASDIRAELYPRHGLRTGSYQAHITASRNRVTDSGIIYGHWIEGSGSRNRTTRFKGYHIFRLVTQRLQVKASRIAERVLDRYLGRMQ